MKDQILESAALIIINRDFTCQETFRRDTHTAALAGIPNTLKTFAPVEDDEYAGFDENEELFDGCDFETEVAKIVVSKLRAQGWKITLG